ncbi:band 7 protein [Gluconacetobacter diazotrophicus PA1 5]|uniref:Prohibitin family protein n=1 Tax=Gluconacetobacter diazotrophicus TaxID=33996 RepID=A0A7W4I600_GLUDI|nr:SPFH domain-containing protein [Gluconacetobacter diazotrophicus]ACI52125.1 band 7 protein [Gluconacetobacter diazotrophicus PA1 5]MBB2156888.1 prohibitin family protein [Gluconacetobacter diazotrophicus]TWB01025.1 regulator of protease activity HflC (stomatin/prohibitin superfamily) [Gluconacetobacter diazotrophicus]
MVFQNYAASPKSLARYGVIAIGGLVILSLLSGSGYTIDQKNIGVVTRFGAVSRTAGPGLHFKLPWIESVTEYSTAIQQVEIQKSEVFTADNQGVDVTMLVQFAVPDSDVRNLYEHVPYYERRIYTLANDRMKSAFGKRQVADVPRSRAQIEGEIKSDVAAQAMALYGIEVSEVQITDLDYTAAFRNAIDMMTKAKAEVTRSEQLRQKALIDAERQQIAARANADAAVAGAEGEARSIKARSEAEAAATRIKGEAEADAIRAQAAALGASPEYVSYTQAKRWDGKLPSTILGSQPMPMLNMSMGH